MKWGKRDKKSSILDCAQSLHHAFLNLERKRKNKG
jgi:hypothetical protein